MTDLHSIILEHFKANPSVCIEHLVGALTAIHSHFMEGQEVRYASEEGNITLIVRPFNKEEDIEQGEEE